MATLSQPLVSIVTPVYNGDKHITDCIESVLAQSYRNWEYIIVNNCSNDGTESIVERYAAKDPRIKAHNNDVFLDLIPNWNHALNKISKESKYCKIIHADDCLFSECLERMVGLAEQHPSIGIVGAYVLKGNKIQCDGLPYPSDLISGKEICRATLLKKFYLFGSPTSTMIRSDVIRTREKFYNENNFHADVEACYEVLQDHDFGFVHEVLTYTRLHDESQTSMYADRLNTNLLENLGMLKKFGPKYLSESELGELINNRLKMYYRALAKATLKGGSGEVLRYHKQSLSKVGFEFDNKKYMRAIMSKLLDLALNPKRTIESVLSRMNR